MLRPSINFLWFSDNDDEPSMRGGMSDRRICCERCRNSGKSEIGR
ncbi:hypothetical protein WG66_002769 [Moniliophthora roreri]|nr:hypothetical protein WG66_002769 [Moniliophthora roreri]